MPLASGHWQRQCQWHPEWHIHHKPAGVPSGSAMISDLSFNSRDSLGVIRLVSFPGVLILGLSLL